MKGDRHDPSPHQSDPYHRDFFLGYLPGKRGDLSPLLPDGATSLPVLRHSALLAVLVLPAYADTPVVTAVEAHGTASGWSFSVTVSHPDTGWDHYADAWEVSLEDGTMLGHRTLHHPHVEEQPFTRSLSGVAVPEGTRTVFVRARDSVHGWGEPVRVTLPN